MKIFMIIAGGVLFLGGIIAHIWVKIKLRPGERSSLENFYYEFEDRHPDLARYNKWSQITFGIAVVGALLVFLVILF